LGPRLQLRAGLAVKNREHVTDVKKLTRLAHGGESLEIVWLNTVQLFTRRKRLMGSDSEPA
jgi:hypothetical protein